MIDVRVPPELQCILDDTLAFCKSIIEASTSSFKRIMLKRIKTNIAAMLTQRITLLHNTGYSASDCINLSTVQRMPQLQRRYVVIKINDVIAPIRIAEDTIIADNFDATLYSINKYGKQQQIEHANKFDVELYRIIIHYKTMRAQFIKDNPQLLIKYKPGDRIKITLFNGVYVIETMTDVHVRITCNKWRAEGRKPMTIRITDIKGYAYEL